MKILRRKSRDSSSSNATNGDVTSRSWFPFRRKSSGDASRPRSSSSSRDPATINGRASGEGFRIVIPEGVRPGSTQQIRAPDGTLVEIVLPAHSRPGEVVTVQLPNAAAHTGSRGESHPQGVRGTLQAILDTRRAAREDLQNQLKTELELQRALWISARSVNQQNNQHAFLQQQALVLAQHNGDEGCFTQTQALVLAAAECGDSKQLLGAIKEAERFTEISPALVTCVEALASEEEATLTWQCIADAVNAGDRHSLQVWLEQAEEMNLEVPVELQTFLAELQTQEEKLLARHQQTRDARQLVSFALEAKNPELLEEALRELEAVGGKDARASATLRQWKRGETASDSQSAERPTQQSKAKAKPLPPQSRPSQTQQRPEPSPDPASSSNPFTDTRASKPANYSNHSSAQPKQAEEDSSDESDTRTAKDLLEECKRKGLDTTGCLDRADLLRLLKANPHAKEKDDWDDTRESTRPQVPRSTITRPQLPRSTETFSWRQQAQNINSTTPTVWDRCAQRGGPPSMNPPNRPDALWLLGITTSFPSQNEIKKAYRRTALEAHPDKIQNHGRAAAAKDLFQLVHQAYDFLNRNC